MADRKAPRDRLKEQLRRTERRLRTTIEYLRQLRDGEIDESGLPHLFGDPTRTHTPESLMQVAGSAREELAYLRDQLGMTLLQDYEFRIPELEEDEGEWEGSLEGEALLEGDQESDAPSRAQEPPRRAPSVTAPTRAPVRTLPPVRRPASPARTPTPTPAAHPPRHRPSEGNGQMNLFQRVERFWEEKPGNEAWRKRWGWPIALAALFVSCFLCTFVPYSVATFFRSFQVEVPILQTFVDPINSRVGLFVYENLVGKSAVVLGAVFLCWIPMAFVFGFLTRGMWTWGRNRKRNRRRA